MANKKDDKILQSMRDFKERAEGYWYETYQKALEDIEFCVNKEAQWDERARRQREEEGRPCISINKIKLFVKQQVNALRANKMTLNAIPVGNDDVGKAEIQDAMLEYILKSSRSDTATDWAYERAVMGGFGFWRITTEYASEVSFDQEIRIKRIENPQSTYLSPEIKCPVGSDATEALTGEWMSKSEFERQFPGFEAVSADEDDSTDWETSDTVFVAEYYRVEYDKDTLYLFDNGETALESDLKSVELAPDAAAELEGLEKADLITFAASMQFNEPVTIVDKRPTQKKRIMWYKCSRDAVLEQTEIKADYIPIILVIGDEQWVENKRYWMSLINEAKDPQIFYNYARTAQLEQLQKAGNRPWVADGQSIEGYEEYWAQSNNPNTHYLPYNSVNEMGHQLAPPFMPAPYQGSPDLMREAMTASEEIKATTGIFDASLGNQGNETSGRAIMARQRQGDQANFHFLDNFKRSYEHAGRVILSMIPHYYDTPRVLRITQDDTVYKTLVINMPADSPAAQKYQKELEDAQVGINGLYNDVTVGKYDIRIAAGADYNTQREEAREVLIELGRAYPQLMQVAGDLIMRAFDFPDADKLADRLKLLLPPQLQEEGEGQELPPEVQQQMAQIQQQMQQMQQALQQAQAELADKDKDRQLEMLKVQLKAESDIEVAKIRESGRTDQEEIKQFGSVLQTILDRTADLQQAMAEMQYTPIEWQETDDYTQDPATEQGFLMPEEQPMPQDMQMPEQMQGMEDMQGMEQEFNPQPTDVTGGDDAFSDVDLADQALNGNGEMNDGI